MSQVGPGTTTEGMVGVVVTTEAVAVACLIAIVIMTIMTMGATRVVQKVSLNAEHL